MARLEGEDLPLLVRLRLPLTRTLFGMRLHIARRPTFASRRFANAAPRGGASDRPLLQLFTIAFNNPTVIELQDRLLRRNVCDPYHWTVVDNSSDRRARRAIARFCNERGIAYLRVPSNPYTGRDPSRSHAEALNYVVRRCTRRLAAPVIGFLDHDVFPVRDVNITERIGSAVAYGRRRERGGTWYLWPGLLFLRWAEVDVRSLDFHPRDGGDTGAGLFRAVYRELAPAQVVYTSDQARTLGAGEGNRYEMFDEWMHAVNASRWRPTARTDEQIVDLVDRVIDQPSV